MTFIFWSYYSSRKEIGPTFSLQFEHHRENLYSILNKLLTTCCALRPTKPLIYKKT